MEYYIDEVRTRAISVPDVADIEALEVGDYVKLILIPSNMPKEQPLRGERLWVKITEIDLPLFWGKIDNDPVLVKATIGDLVQFKVDQVAGIFIPPGGDGERRKVRSKEGRENKPAH